MFDFAKVFQIFNCIDELGLNIVLDEDKDFEHVNLSNFRDINPGNNCLHYIITHDNHRIVLQCYKNLYRPTHEVDIVQGKVESDSVFGNLVNILNYISDWYINYILITYLFCKKNHIECPFSDYDSTYGLLDFYWDGMYFAYDQIQKDWTIGALNFIAGIEDVQRVLNFINNLKQWTE